MANQKPDANEKRYGDVTLEDVEAQISLLKGVIARLEVYKLEIRAKKRPVTVDGATKFKRGFDLITSFASNLGEAILHAPDLPQSTK